MYANIAQLQNDMTNSLHAQATANQMITLSKASQSYITTNYKTLSRLASSPLEVPITGNSNWQDIGDLTSTGLLPDTFTNNMPFGQKVHLVVRKINATSTIPEHLEGMLLTDGGAPMIICIMAKPHIQLVNRQYNAQLRTCCHEPDDSWFSCLRMAE